MTSKSELKRQCVMNPLEMAEELAELKQREMVLVGVLRDIAYNFDCDSDAHKYGTTCRACAAKEALSHTQQQTADQVLRCNYCEGRGYVDAGVYKTVHTHYSICPQCKGKKPESKE